MIGLVVVVAVVWVVLAVIVGLGVAQIIRRRDRQVPGEGSGAEPGP